MIIKIPALYWVFVGQVPSSASELHTWTCCVVKLVDRRASVNRKNCEESTMYLCRAELIIALHIKPFSPFWLRRSLIYFQFGFHSSLSMSSSPPLKYYLCVSLVVRKISDMFPVWFPLISTCFTVYRLQSTEAKNMKIIFLKKMILAIWNNRRMRDIFAEIISWMSWKYVYMHGPKREEWGPPRGLQT